MRGDDLEGRLRTVLRTDGDGLPLTITPEELERRLSLRRRERMGRRFSVVAAGVAVIVVGSALLLSGGWLRSADVGSAPSPSSGIDTGHAQVPAISIPSGATKACQAIDPATLTEPPTLRMGAVPGDAKAFGGLGSSFRLGDRQVGEEGTWDHDSIWIDPVLAGHPAERLSVQAGDPDACLIGLRVDAVPTENPGAEPIRVADITSDPTSTLEFPVLPVGDWLAQVHADLATTPGTVAWRETFFYVEVADCSPIDPATLESPPALGAGVADGDAIGIGGIQTAFEWGGRRVGSVGSRDGLTSDMAAIRVHPTSQAIRLVSDACMFDFTAEAVRIDDAGKAEADSTPWQGSAIRGVGTKAIAIGGPPVGDWALLVHAGFLTTDGLPAWSETLFRVESQFDSPGLTIGPDFFEVMANAACPTYDLATGVRGSGACVTGYALMDGREPVPVSSGAPLQFSLTDDWVIDEARVVAVDAGLIEGGFFAPEYSVSFQEQVGDTLTIPVELDPGSWILRISLNGIRQGDTFGAHYDVAVNVTP